MCLCHSSITFIFSLYNKFLKINKWLFGKAELACNFDALPTFLFGLEMVVLKGRKESGGGRKMMTYGKSKTSFDWV